MTNPNMIQRMAADLVNLLHAEIHDRTCPEESMSRYLENTDAILHDCQLINGSIIVTIKKNDNRLFDLELKPVSWKRNHET